MANAIQSIFLSGPAGRLEALLNVGAPGAPYAALVCHPHPLYGGTMHNKVVFKVAQALQVLGMPALRFNFRGVGHSTGTYDEGRGEMDDVRFALEFLSRRYPGLPVILGGFSFGRSSDCLDDWIGVVHGPGSRRSS